MWPQYMMLGIALATLYTVAKDAVTAPPDQSHGYVVAKLVASCLYIMFIAFVLHAGGFW